MLSSKAGSICLIGDISVDEFLKLNGFSRSFIKKFKFSKKFLNKKGTVKLPLNLVNNLLIFPYFFRQDCKVIFEDENIFAIHKPHNLHSHPLSYSEWDNCLSYLRKCGRSDILKVNKDSYDRGLLYRLDFGTSGLLIFSKQEKLIKIFRESPKKKYYLAIVQGRINAHFHYQHYIDYHGQKKRKACAAISENPNSEIKGELVAFNEKRQLSLVLVELSEGRRHQIRVQLSAAGFPIYGDVFYGAQAAERIFLHAYNYQFCLNGKNYNQKDSIFTYADQYFSIDDI
jgi:23S rRNA pseudouridine1911/1915/1917 synthase